MVIEKLQVDRFSACPSCIHLSGHSAIWQEAFVHYPLRAVEGQCRKQERQGYNETYFQLRLRRQTSDIHSIFSFW